FDHAGFPLKPMVMETVAAAGHEPLDLGTWSLDPVDYPDTARAAAEAVRSGDADRAVLVCGSGAGVAVAACKFPNIRAAVAHDTCGETISAASDDELIRRVSEHLESEHDQEPAKDQVQAMIQEEAYEATDS